MSFRLAPLTRGPLPKAPEKNRRAKNEGKDPKYMAWLHELECCVTGRTTGLVAHHPTVARGRMGRKEDDATAVPVAEEYHSDQYATGLHRGERRFWNRYGIDPTALADDLYAVFTTHGPAKAAGHEIIRMHRQMGQVRVRQGIKVFQEK